MSERTAMDIAIDLDAVACSAFVKLEAAKMLRSQAAEIDRLIAERDAAIAAAVAAARGKPARPGQSKPAGEGGPQWWRAVGSGAD